MVASHNVPRAPADASPESTPGFAIRLPSAQLADLIQINCINRIRGVFRVASRGGEGHLFFDGGLLVHADCAGHIGLDAVVVMLGWRSGSIEPCSLPWPAESSIGMGADALLLHAAQRIDERARQDAPRADVTTKVVRRVAWPPAEPGTEAGSLPAAEAVSSTPAAPSTPAPVQRTSEHSGLSLVSPRSAESLSRLEVTRITPEGNIQHSRAGASTDLADTAFFCQRLASLLGDGLGLGPCRALACESASEGIVVFKGRSIVGARGRRRDLDFVLAKVGLG
jgi:uncharacterized protein DUF4388